MPASPKPYASASAIFAAVVAILAGLFALLVTSLGFFGILLGTTRGVSPELPPFVKNMTLAVMAFMACLSAFGVAVGIGLILLRNWARISVLIWGGLCVFFGIFGVAIAFVIPLAPPPNAPNITADSMQAVRFIILGIYGLPLVVGIWWLILFNRKTVKAQFAATASPLDPAVPQKPRPPLPIAILAWFLITGAAHVVILPFLPFPIPVSLFGHFFYGTAATLSYVCLCLISVVAGVGLLKLKPWSYALEIALQLFGLANVLFTILSPDYPAQMASFMEKIYASMNLPANSYYSSGYLLHARSSMAFVFVFFLAIIGMLFYYRERFMEAASSAASKA